MSKNKALTKLILSLTTAAALSATAVFSSNQPVVNAAKVTGAQYEKNLRTINDQLNNNKIINMQIKYNDGLKSKYQAAKNEYFNTKSQLDNYGVNIAQSQNSVSVNLPSGYKTNVQNTLNNYMQTKDPDTLSKNQQAIVMSSKPAVINKNPRNYNYYYPLFTYTGHTKSDGKKFYVNQDYNTIKQQLTKQDLQEIQQVVANAGNALRQATGIQNQVGSLIPNSKAESISQNIMSNSQNLNDFADQEGINFNLLSDIFNSNVNDGTPSSLQTYKSDHRSKKLESLKSVLTLADIKQLYLNTQLSTTQQIGLLGLDQYQLDNVNNNGVSDSYVGFDNTSGTNLQNSLVTIPTGATSFPTTDAMNTMSQANLTTTNASSDADKTQLENVVAANKQDYESKKKQVDAFFDKYNRLTGNPKNNRVAGTNSMRWQYFGKTGKVYIPGGYKVPASIKKLKS